MLTTHQYDAKDGLTKDATGGLNTDTYNYGYDPLDNRVTSTETGYLATATYNAAQEPVTSVEIKVGTTTFGYDLNGNLANIASRSGAPITMSYDMENRLSVHQSGAARSNGKRSPILIENDR